MADQQPPQLSWSGSFNVDTLLKGPTGDKINLPSSALEQLLNANAAASPAAIATTRASSFSHFSRVPNYDTSEQNAQQLPYPLMFRLVNERNGKTVYAGVREFSAEEGRVLLSPFLLRSLDLPSDPDAADADAATNPHDPPPRVKITAHQLPKGHYVALSPKHDYARYDPSVLEPLLERELRQGYTTLSVGTTLCVRSGLREEYEFLVESVKPEGDGICVIDTDLELDLLRVPTATDQGPVAGQTGGTWKKDQKASDAADKSSPGGEIGFWKSVEGQVQHDEYVDYELVSWDHSRGVSIELAHQDDADSSLEFFLDLFVSPKTARIRERPRETQHWKSFMGPHNSLRSTKLDLPSTHIFDEEVESLMISVYGYRDERLSAVGTRPHKFSLKVKPAEDGKQNGASAVTIPADTADKQKCSNCGQWIAKQNYMLHSLRCARNKKCPTCGLVAAADELREHWHCSVCGEHEQSGTGDSLVTKAKHDSRFHPEKPFRCSCSDIFAFGSVRELAEHRMTVCPEKIILCRFCHLEVPQEGDATDPSSISEASYTGLTAHERADGARTTNCDLCNAIVRLRDMAAHLQHHDLNKKGRVAPALCRNALCGRTLHGVGPRGQVLGPGANPGGGGSSSNDLGLCATCYGPLYVSMHDPEGRALRRRVERRYLTQLISGCGRAWCSNEWCRTGRANTGRDAVGATASAALQLVKGFVTPEAIRDRSEKMRFCVDETGQRNLVLAEMLASEGVWGLEWCVAGCEAEGDRDKAREWLQKWAPNKYE